MINLNTDTIIVTTVNILFFFKNFKEGNVKKRINYISILPGPDILFGRVEYDLRR